MMPKLPAGRSRLPLLLLLVPALAAACLVGQAPPTATPFVPSATPLPQPEVPHSTVVPTLTAPPPTLPPSPTAPPTPGPTPLPIFGLELSALDPAYGLTQAKELGVYWARRAGVWWPDVEAVEGSPDWGVLAAMEQELSLASSQGMEVILVVRGTPEWAQAVPGSFCGPILQEKLPAFGAFVGELVRRYSVAPYNVRYWEIWNEPDVDPDLVPGDSPFGCWGDQDDPYYGGGYYAEALKAVYPEVKAANPDALLLVGGLLLDCDPVNPPPNSDCTPAKFLEGALVNGAAPFFDGVSFHAYDYYYNALGKYAHPGWQTSSETTGPVTLAKVAYLKNLLEAYGASDKFLMNTEAALICGRTGDEPKCQTTEAAETKSYYVVEVYAAALSAGLQANVWYSLTGWRGSGLTDTSLNPLPALNAYRFVAGELRNAQFTRQVADYAGIRGYEFQTDSQVIWLLWSPDGVEHSAILPQSPAGLFDVYGQSLSLANEIRVGRAPIYVVWN